MYNDTFIMIISFIKPILLGKTLNYSKENNKWIRYCMLHYAIFSI